MKCSILCVKLSEQCLAYIKPQMLAAVLGGVGSAAVSFL